MENSLLSIDRMADKYNQDAIIYSGPETEGKAALFFKDEGKISLNSIMIIGDFNPMKIVQAYSKLRHKFDWIEKDGKREKEFRKPITFVFEGFEGFEQTYNNFIEATIDKAYQKLL